MAYNANITLLPPAARTATANSSSIKSGNHRGVRVTTTVTAKDATPSLTISIQGWNPVTNTWTTLLAGAALTDVGTQTLLVYPGAPVTANVSANAPISPVFRVLATHGDADEIDYSVVAELLV